MTAITQAPGSSPDPGSGPQRSSSPVLIGRETQLARLLEAASNPPAVAVIDGEAGVGKSRLVREMARDAGIANGRVLLGHCHPFPEPFPLGPVVEALVAVGGEPLAGPAVPLLGALRPLLPELAAHLPPELGRLPDPHAQRHRVFRALRALLAALGPTVCILEDVHWADERTLEFLCFVAAAVPKELSLVLTHRTEDLDSSPRLPGLMSTLCRHGVPTTTMGLAALSPCEVRALVASMIGMAVSQDFAMRLHEATAGIPFAVEEVVNLLRDRGDLGPATRCPSPALQQLVVPRAVRDPILQRLGRLDEDARLIAWAAAVLGVPAEEQVLTDVAGLRARRGATALVQGISAGVLQERGEGLYSFRHALATQAVYGAIAGPHRRWLHLRAGRALERRRQPQPLAHIARHLKEGGSGKWPRYAEAAAKAASSAGDDRLAAGLLEDALTASELPRTARIRMALALGEVAIYCTPATGAIRILRQTLEEATLAAGVRGQLRLSLSRLLGHAGDAAGWRKEAALAVEELRRRPALGVRAMINLAQPLSHTDGELADHLAWLDRAVLTARRDTDRVARIAVASQRAAILLSLGDRGGWAAVRDIPQPADTAEEKLQLSRGYLALASAAMGLGHYARGESFLAEADRIQAQIGHRSWGPWLEAAHASVDWCRGRWEGLEDRLRRLVEEAASTPALSLSTQFALGSLLLAKGELDEARRILSAALETAHRTQELSHLVIVSGRLARLHLDRGDALAAGDLTAAALHAVRSKGVWVLGRSFASEAVQAFLVGGDPESARGVVAEFAVGLRGLDAPATRAAMAWCRGTLAEADDRAGAAARQFARSEHGWGRLPNRYEAARARERRARCASAEDGPSAERLRLSALETFQDLGADGDARRVRAQLKAEWAWRGGRTGYGDRLSPREAQVARLAGMRHSNREIAEALFISPRTVELHVAASLRKLDLRSRHELGQAQGTIKDT